MSLIMFGGVGQQTKLLTKQNPFCLRRMSIHKILFCKWIWKIIHLPAQIYYQYQHKEHDCRCAVQIAVDKHYSLIHGCTSKVKFRPGRFTEIQRRAFHFLLILLLTFCFKLRDSAVAALPLRYTCHNTGIFQTMFIKILLQIGMKIAQFTAVKNIIRANFGQFQDEEEVLQETSGNNGY